LHAPNEGALQRFGDEWILLSSKVPLGSAGSFAGPPDGCQIDESVAVAVNKVLEQARDFGFGDWVFDVFDKPGQSQNLALAHQLLRQVRLKKLNFLGQRTRQFGLLHPLGIDELFLAEFQHLAVVQANGQRADQQQRAQDKPQNAHTSAAHTRPQGWICRRHSSLSILGEFLGTNAAEWSRDAEVQLEPWY